MSPRVIAGRAPAKARLEGLLRWLMELRARADREGVTARRYLVVTPLGLPHRAAIERGLRVMGVDILGRLRLSAWARLSSALHVTELDRPRLLRAALYERAWRTLFPGAPGEAWRIDRAAFARLTHAKRALRVRLPAMELRFDGLATLRGVLHAFHLADLSDGEDASRRLEAALRLGPR